MNEPLAVQTIRRLLSTQKLTARELVKLSHYRISTVYEALRALKPQQERIAEMLVGRAKGKQAARYWVEL